jgi:Zn-dependent M28 family amino/carboxypeptidase
MRGARRTVAGILLLAAVAAPAAQPTASVDGAQLLRDLQTLAADDMEGREPGTPGGARARAYIVKRFSEIGIQPIGGSYERWFRFSTPQDKAERPGVNIVGVIRGRRDPDRYIAVTAHYDHLGTKNGQVFNGADDNASGVAAMLAIAHQLSLHPPDHSILFVAFDAEETGLNGSRDFVRSPPGPLSAIALNLNLDMVARDAKNRLYAVGTQHNPFLKRHLEGTARPPVTLVFGHDVAGAKEEDWTRDSDHFPFHQAGIPFIYFGVEDYEQHHKPTDDAQTVTKEFFVGAANTILAAVRKCDANLAAIQKRR